MSVPEHVLLARDRAIACVLVGCRGSSGAWASQLVAARDARYRSGSHDRVRVLVTAKEKLRAAVEELSESEATDTLDYIASRRHSATDALGELLENAPWDDEPTTPEEQSRGA